MKETTMKVTNVSGEDRQIDSVGLVVDAGETVDVDPDVAGRPPDDDDLGAGLLAQPANWAPGDPQPAKASQAPAGGKRQREVTG